jgi:Acyl-CoA carboxylase epsilon subunit
VSDADRPTDGDPTAEPVRPLLRIVRGDPTPEELAAVVTVVTAAIAPSATTTDEPRGQWRARGRNIRPALSRGPDAWRASGFPR